MGFIYLLNMVGTDYYKIGITKRDLKKRINELQTGCPDKIELINHFECTYYYKVESWLHRIYKNKRLNGEWFILDDADVNDFINKCETLHDNVVLLINENPYYN